jgi:hypothetical protein
MPRVWRQKGPIGMGLPLFPVVLSLSQPEATPQPLPQETTDEARSFRLQDP